MRQTKPSNSPDNLGSLVRPTTEALEQTILKAELQDAYETLLGERRRLAPFKGIADVNLRDYVILVQIQSEELRRENTALKQRVKRLNEPNHEHWMERTEGTLPATLA